MKQTLEEAVNEIGGVHPDWNKIRLSGCLKNFAKMANLSKKEAAS